MNTPRAEVYRAVDSERDYQDSFVKNKYADLRPEDQRAAYLSSIHPTAAEILMIEEYAARARKEWTDNKGDGAALEMIRKVAALCVRCMENHGAPFRSFSVTHES